MSIDLHSLMAPYALDALERDERTRFEAHLDQCVDCQAELAGFMATAVRLGDAVSHTPPPALRDRLLSEITQTSQERPVVTALAQRRSLRRTLPRLAMAAAFLVGAVGVGGYVVEHENASEARNDKVAISQVIGADDVATSAKSFTAGGTVRMYASPSADAAVIIAHDMPSPGKGKVYQVWMIDKSGPTSQGTFVDDGEMIMKGVAGADRVAVTVEPQGGSKQPTSAPVATIPV
ncbi:anti-sigma factor [Aeromicrobium stalagmiti]|uniref:anti-sigma factor n=1 Tax=Aeromicrobium stalagmiti TaxID=2738988 RepID=UPI001568CDFC|nr:anti-sigma factor [Aeromicrobium stalagmiti]NRQ50648.1 anti-sigma factor [Aeromicrobium stalagmiti]